MGVGNTGGWGKVVLSLVYKTVVAITLFSTSFTRCLILNPLLPGKVLLQSTGILRQIFKVDLQSRIAHRP